MTIDHMLGHGLGQTHQGKVDLVTQSAAEQRQDDHVLSHGLGQTHQGKLDLVTLDAGMQGQDDYMLTHMLDSDCSQDILCVLLEAVVFFLIRVTSVNSASVLNIGYSSATVYTHLALF